jgi:PAS domain S-box-containing protein
MGNPTQTESLRAAGSTASPSKVALSSDRCHTTSMAVWIAVGYCIVGVLWIATSDYVVAWLISDHDALSRVQTYKGWGYILVTAVLLGALVKMLLSRIERSQDSVRQSELRFRLVTEAATDAIWDWNLLTDDLWWNEGVTTLFGYTPEETAGGITWWEGHLHPEDHDRVIRELQAAIDSGQVAWSDEYRFRRADGTYADVYDRGSVIHEASGLPVRMIGGMTDITRRKRAEQTLRERLEVERMLLQELDHRVRNNLTALLSLVDMTRRSVDDIEGFAERITGRVRAMASVHGMLSDSRWGSLRLQSLITSIAPPECIKRIFLKGDDEPIPSRQVTGLAMVLHELMTNSLKHGALSVPEGRLDISWSVATEPVGAARTLTIRWREQGGPEVQDHPAPSVGMELVDGLTRTELRGHAEVSFSRGGADHTLSVTLDETDQEGVPGLAIHSSEGSSRDLTPIEDRTAMP